MTSGSEGFAEGASSLVRILSALKQMCGVAHYIGGAGGLLSTLLFGVPEL